MSKNSEQTTNSTLSSIELPAYYTVDDIRTILRLGRTRTYRFIEEAYRKKDSFKVRMICGMYRIEKKSFDMWLDDQ